MTYSGCSGPSKEIMHAEISARMVPWGTLARPGEKRPQNPELTDALSLCKFLSLQAHGFC